MCQGKSVPETYQCLLKFCIFTAWDEGQLCSGFFFSSNLYSATQKHLLPCLRQACFNSAVNLV